MPENLIKNWAMLATVTASGVAANLLKILPASLIELLVALMLIDVIAGLLLAIYQHRLNSSIMGKGLLRKTLTILSICALALVDLAIFHTATLAAVISIFFIICESLSILEKAAKMGVPLPSGIIRRLEKLRAEYSDISPSSEKQEAGSNDRKP